MPTKTKIEHDKKTITHRALVAVHRTKAKIKRAVVLPRKKAETKINLLTTIFHSLSRLVDSPKKIWQTSHDTYDRRIYKIAEKVHQKPERVKRWANGVYLIGIGALAHKLATSIFKKKS